MPETKASFEDNIDYINQELAKRKSLWTLTSVQWLDWDDVSQLIRLHIYQKWHLYNSSKPLGPWLNRVISHQIKNIIRNVYGNYVRPCLRCCAAEGENLCKIYSTQCSSCPLYAVWEKSKKQAYSIKVPVSLEHVQNYQEISEYSDAEDIDAAAKKIHTAMEKILKAHEWTIYKYLFIDNMPENEVAIKLGLKTSEDGRNPGYRQIKNIRKNIMNKLKKALKNDQIDIR
jgi:hypothetical protein